MLKQVYEIDSNGYLEEIYVKEFDEQYLTTMVSLNRIIEAEKQMILATPQVAIRQ